MKIPTFLAAICGLIAGTVGYSADRLPPPMVRGLNHPAGVAVASDGKIYVTAKGADKKDGKGQGDLGDKGVRGVILRIENGKAIPFAAWFDTGHSFSWNVTAQTPAPTPRDRCRPSPRRRRG